MDMIIIVQRDASKRRIRIGCTLDINYQYLLYQYWLMRLKADTEVIILPDIVLIFLRFKKKNLKKWIRNLWLRSDIVPH